MLMQFELSLHANIQKWMCAFMQIAVTYNICMYTWYYIYIYIYIYIYTHTHKLRAHGLPPSWWMPLGTWLETFLGQMRDEKNDNDTMLQVCCDVATLLQSCCDVATLLRRCCDVATLLRRCFDVATLLRRCCDVVGTVLTRIQRMSMTSSAVTLPKITFCTDSEAWNKCVCVFAHIFISACVIVHVHLRYTVSRIIQYLRLCFDDAHGCQLKYSHLYV